MLKTQNTTLVIVDVQGKLANLMHNSADLFANIKTMIKGAKILEMPILCLEQLPEKLGPTVPEIAELLADIETIDKFSFSACKNERFVKALEALNTKHVLLLGIEAHICVYQTAIELKKMQYEVEIVVDAVSSRTAENKRIALEKMKTLDIGMTSTEMALFELLEFAQGENFKKIINIIK
jgi:nicotinamidase-related amidase